MGYECPACPESGLCGQNLDWRECSGVDLGSSLCNLESSAVVAGSAGLLMLWEAVHPRAAALLLFGAVSRLLLLDAPCIWHM